MGHTKGNVSSVVLYAFGTILCLGTIFSSLFSSNSVSATVTGSTEGDGTSSTTSITITSSASANLSIVPTSQDGTFAKSSSSEQAAFDVTTNNATGYTLTLAGKDNTRQLVNKVSGTTIGTLESISSSIPESTFNTSDYNNKWGYKPSKINSASNSNFLRAPTAASPDTIDTTSSANATGTSNSYNIDIGARVSYDMPAGNYTNTFVIAAVGNPVPYTINYRDGTGDSSVTGLPYTDDNHTSSSTSVTANYGTTSTITRTGYTFANKWCLGTVNTTGVNPGTTCNGTVYNNGSSIDFIDQTSSSSTVTLYAMWTPNTYSITVKTAEGISSVSLNGQSCSSTSGCTVNNLTYGQPYDLIATPANNYVFNGWSKNNNNGTITDTTKKITTFTVGAGNTTITPSAFYADDVQNYNGCSSLSVGQTTTLVDNRDNQPYTIAKLKDGNCWMIDNLNLGDTDNYPLKADINQDNTNLQVTKTITKETYSGSTWKKTSGTDTYTSPEYIPLNSSNTEDGRDIDATSGTKYGTLYNYCAASAQTICTNPKQEDVTSDLCPAGWRLPTGSSNTNSEFQILYNNYNSYALMKASAANGGAAFAIAGSFSSTGGISGQGNGYGAYWSSTTYNNSNVNMHFLWVRASNSTIWTSANNYGYVGQSIRCIMASTMQDFSITDEMAMAEGETKTLRDVRDNNRYTVAKINGDVWMTKNLRFTGTSLNVSDSNVRHNTTIAYGDLTLGNSYDEPRIHDSGDSTNGVWYNYAAATAGTITGDSNNDDQMYDICPRGWKLPASNNIDNISGATYNISFDPGGSGYYRSGAYQIRNGAWWWSSSLSTATARYQLGYSYDSNVIQRTYDVRTDGIFVRCIFSPTMQDFSNSDAASINNNQRITLRDVRDNKTYDVTKIQDTIWMTQNLRFTGTTLSPDTSNVATDTTMEYYSFETNGGTNGECYGGGSSTTSDINGYTYPCLEEGVDSNNNSTVWYNYVAATAGTISGLNNTNIQRYDICPSGWKLPGETEIAALAGGVGGKSSEYVDAFNAVYGGYYEDRNSKMTLWHQDVDGTWWSAAPSPYFAQSRRDLWYNAGVLRVSVDAGAYRARGAYIRCIFTPSMQNFSGSDASAMEEGETKILRDDRDNKTYTASKINGNVWMTQNLRFVGKNIDSANTMTLDSIATNVAADTTLSYGDLISGDSYDEARVHKGVDNSGDPVVWYNFVAASAGTITGSSNSTDSTSDICPIGWRLPTDAEQQTVGSGAGDSTYSTSWNATYGGFYQGGSLYNASTHGFWWTSTHGGGQGRFSMYYRSGNLYAGFYHDRINGFYIRCIKAS